MERSDVRPSIGNNILYRAYYEHAGTYHVDAIRVGWFSDPRVYPGGSIPKLDREAFEICLTDRSHAAEISADRVAGQDLMVRGTPTFFVGRIDGERIVQARRVVGARKFQDFERVIDEVLKEVERR